MDDALGRVGRLHADRGRHPNRCLRVQPYEHDVHDQSHQRAEHQLALLQPAAPGGGAGFDVSLIDRRGTSTVPHGDRMRRPTSRPSKPTPTTLKPCPNRTCQAFWPGHTTPIDSAPAMPPMRPISAPDRRGENGSDPRQMYNTPADPKAPRSMAIIPQRSA